MSMLRRRYSLMLVLETHLRRPHVRLAVVIEIRRRCVEEIHKVFAVGLPKHTSPMAGNRKAPKTAGVVCCLLLLLPFAVPALGSRGARSVPSIPLQPGVTCRLE